jgi:hypothetical protein
VWLLARLDSRAKPKVGPAADRRFSSFTLRRTSGCGLRKKAARNAPKCHYSRLYRAGVFVFVVAQPIQDMSAVSITHKTVGIRLPRLRCGAIGRRTKHPIKSHRVQSWTRRKVARKSGEWWLNPHIMRKNFFNSCRGSMPRSLGMRVHRMESSLVFATWSWHTH